MFRTSVVVRSADETESSIERLRAALEKSDIPGTSRSFVIDSARETLELWQAQLGRPNTKSLKADKVLKGSDYRIVLRVRSRSGIIGLLRRTLSTR